MGRAGSQPLKVSLLVTCQGWSRYIIDEMQGIYCCFSYNCLVVLYNQLLCKTFIHAKMKGQEKDLTLSLNTWLFVTSLLFQPDRYHGSTRNSFVTELVAFWLYDEKVFLSEQCGTSPISFSATANKHGCFQRKCAPNMSLSLIHKCAVGEGDTR